MSLSGLINSLLKVEPNSNKRDLIRVCSNLIAESHKRVHIVSGELENVCYTHEDILGSIRGAVSRKVDVSVIYGPKADEASLMELSKIPGVRLFPINIRPAAHFMVVDNSVRIEDYHVPFEESRHAYVVRDTTYLADKMEREFTHLVYLSNNDSEGTSE